MFSPQLYETFGIRHKNELLKSLNARCALHGCGNVDHLLDLYPQLTNLAWIEADWQTDLAKLLEVLDRLGIGRVDILLNPAHIMATDEDELQNTLQEMTNLVSPRDLRFRTGPLEHGTSPEKIRTLYEAVAQNSESPVGEWADLMENY